VQRKNIETSDISRQGKHQLEIPAQSKRPIGSSRLGKFVPLIELDPTISPHNMFWFNDGFVVIAHNWCDSSITYLRSQKYSLESTC